MKNKVQRLLVHHIPMAAKVLKPLAHILVRKFRLIIVSTWCNARSPLVVNTQNHCMKKHAVAFLLIMFTILGCHKKFDSPLPHNLQEIISNNNNCTCQPYLNLYEWKGMQAYLYAFRGPACNFIPAYYDAEGKPLMMTATYTFDQFLAESRLLKKIWECK